MKFAIKHEDGTYFYDWSAIGPLFGATEDKNIKKFDTEFEAVQEMTHWAFCQAEVVPYPPPNAA